MADHGCKIETQAFHFESQSPSEWEQKDVLEDDPQLFQDTVPLDDIVALDSSFDETQLKTLDLDTEVVDFPDCVEDLKPHQITDDEKEVVLDSEDEGNYTAEFSSAANGLSDVKTDRRRESQKRQHVASFLQPEYLAETSDGSAGGAGALIVDETTNEGENLPQRLACDQVCPGLNYIGNEEPRESSQANALDFINHYLSLNNAGLSPSTKPTNAVRKKVSPISSIKGCQNLAKQIKDRTHVGKDETFEWVDSDHCRGVDFFSKRMDAAFGLGGPRQRSALRNQKARHVDSKGGRSTDNNCEDKSMNLHKEVTSSPLSNSRISVNSPKEINRIEQASGMNFENNSAKNLHKQLQTVQLVQEMDTCSIERNAPDMWDIGFSTQMAAKAMEALSYGLPTDSSAGDVNQCPQNLHLDSSTSITKSKNHSKKPSLQKGAFFNLEGTARTSRKRKSSSRKGTSSSSWKHFNYQELDDELAMTTKRKRSQSSAGRLNEINSSCPDAHWTRKSQKPAKERKEEKDMTKNNTKQCENHGISSIPFENILLGKQCIQGEPVACQNGSWMTEGTLEATKDGLDYLGQRKNDVVKGGIVTYKRKRSCLGGKPSGVLNAGRKSATLCCKQLIQEETFTHQTGHWMKGDELEETKDGPHNLGKMMNDTMKHGIITYKRKSPSSAKLSEVLNAEEKNTKLCCNIPEVASNNKLTPQEQGSSEISYLTSSLKLNAWTCPKGKRTLRKRPSHSNRANTLSIWFMAIDGKGGYKKPFNKNLPKSSLLKELIRFGIPEPKPDFTWKYLRKRRDMAYVQVLFSQHLDDDIIKQQKKILARFGISIATCSMDATHFIADKFVRTRNMLEAIALGKPVVTHLWLESCGQASCLIDEKNYILRDAKKEKEIGFNMPISLARTKQHPLLKGRRVLITPNIKPEKEMITSLVKAVHGQAVEKSQISALKTLDDLLILSCEEDHAVCLPFLDKEAAVYSSELLLNGIVIQKLEYERHQLFTNYAKRNHRSSKR